MKMTIEQNNITREFEKAVLSGEKKAFFLNAVAGSGKTTTIMMQIELLKELEQKTGRKLNACSLSFNRNIMLASQAKLDKMHSSVKALTTNSLGRQILAKAASRGQCTRPELKADSGKYTKIVRDMMAEYRFNPEYFSNTKNGGKEYTKAVAGAIKLVEAVRSTRVAPTAQNMVELVLHYQIEDVNILAPSFELIQKIVPAAIRKGIELYTLKGHHDFNDQIMLPLDLDVTSQEWDIIFIDEAQDLNRARLEMICRCIKDTGILFFVGDPRQSIQGFTYADTEAVTTIKRETGAEEYPLSMCWRCPVNVIRLAEVLVPHIKAGPDAAEGVVTMIASDMLYKHAQTGYKRGEEEIDPSLVLCRVKAPLMSGCLELIAAGIPAIVRGRDIGRGLLALLDELEYDEFEDILMVLEDYTSKQIAKLFGKKDAEQKIQSLEDTQKTIEALFTAYTKDGYIADMVNFQDFISSKFADDDTPEQAAKDRVKPVVFSTVHKAKGLEYDKVFILSPELMPHPMAAAGWQTEQEYNILYVAITRAKKELVFVGGVPTCLTAVYYEINPVETAQVAPELPVNAESLLADEITATDVQEAAEQENAGKVETRGRKARQAEDKPVQAYFRVDPSIKAGIDSYVEALKETNFHEVIPVAGEKLSFNDYILQLVLNDEKFMEHFKTTPEYAAYEERQARINAWKNEKASKKNGAGPDDDTTPPGGGLQVTEQAAEPAPEETTVLTGYAELAVAALRGSDRARQDLEMANLKIYLELQEKQMNAAIDELEDEQVIESTIEAIPEEPTTAEQAQETGPVYCCICQREWSSKGDVTVLATLLPCKHDILALRYRSNDESVFYKAVRLF